MKKSIFVSWLCVLVLVISSIYAAFSYFFLISGLNRVDNLIAEMARSESQAIISTLRDDILNGNFVQLEVTLAKVSQSGGLRGIEVIPHGAEAFKIPRNQDFVSDVTVDQRIYFGEGSSEWGTVRLFYDGTKAKLIKKDIYRQFIFSLAFIFVLFASMGLVGSYFLWDISGTVLTAFEESIQSRIRPPMSFSRLNPKSIWSPTFDRAYDIGAKYRASRDKVEELSRREASSRAIAQVAHDLRTPLSSLRIVLFKSVDKTSSAYEIGTRAIDRSESILKEALGAWREPTLSQAHNHGIDQEPEYDICAAIQEVIVEYRQLNPAYIFEFINLVQGSLIVTGEKLQIQRVLQNILNNAVDAQKEIQKVTITLEFVFGVVHIRIRDFGAGFSDSALANAFVDGFSEKRTFADAGTGLGLTDVRSRVRNQGGVVGLWNEASPSGAVVSLLLPL